MLLDGEGRQSSLKQNIDLKINKAKQTNKLDTNLSLWWEGKELAMKTNEMQSSS